MRSEPSIERVIRTIKAVNGRRYKIRVPVARHRVGVFFAVKRSFCEKLKQRGS